MPQSRFIVLLVPAVLAFATAPAFAKTLTVTEFRDDPAKPLPGSLRFFLTDTTVGALPGDTIQFAPGLDTVQLAGPVSLDFAGVTIEGPVRIVEQPGGFTAFLDVVANDVTVRGITFELGAHVSVNAGISGTKILGNRFVGGAGVSSRQSFGTVVGTVAEPNTFEKAGVLSEIDTDMSVAGNTFGNVPIGVRAVGEGVNVRVESNTLDKATIEVEVRSGSVSSNTITVTASAAITVDPTSIPGYGMLAISGNTIRASGRASGIDVTGRGRLAITGNTITGTKAKGLGIGFGCGGAANEIEGTIDIGANTVTGFSTGIGFACLGPQAPVVTIHDNADISRNSSAGLFVRMSAQGKVTVTANHFTDNGTGAKGAGVQVATSGAPVEFSGNQVTRNPLGVDVGTGAGRVSFQGDAVEANRADGFRFAAATATITGATCKGNGGAGVFVGLGGTVTVSQTLFGDNRGPGIDLDPKGVTANAAPKNGNADRDFAEPFAFDPATQSLTGTTTPSAMVDLFRVADGARRGNPANGEGTAYLGSVTAGPDGRFAFPVTGKVGDVFTCTSTTPGPNGMTSEFAPDAYFVPKPPPPAQTTDERKTPVYVVTAAGRFSTLDPDNSPLPQEGKPLTGLAPGERLLGMDLLQGSQDLLGLSSLGILYIVDPATRVCTAFNPTALNLTPPAGGIELEAKAGSFAEVNLVRGTGIVTQISLPLNRATDFSQPLHSGSGASTFPYFPAALFDEYYDGELVPGFNQPATFTTFGIDATNDLVFRITNLFSGTAVTVGPLGIDVTTVAGADADFFTKRALMAATTGSSLQVHLYELSLATGAATDLGELGTPDDPVIAFCFGSPPPCKVDYFLTDGTAWSTTLVPGANPAPATPLASFHPVLPLRSAAYQGPTDVVAIDAQGTVHRYDVKTRAQREQFDVTETILSLATFPSAQPGRIDVSTSDGRFVRVDLATKQAVLDRPLVYAPGDLNAALVPKIGAMTNYGSFGGATLDSAYAVDIQSPATQWFSVFDPASPGLATRGQMYAFAPTGVAALTLLPDGTPFFETENEVSHTANFCFIRPDTGITVPFATFPVAANGPKILGMFSPKVTAGESAAVPVGASARISLTGRDFFTLLVKPNTPPKAKARKTPSAYAGIPFVVDVGGLARLVVPAANGRGRSGNASLSVTTRPDGAIDTISFTVSGEFSSVLAASGLDLADDAHDEPHTLPVTIGVGDEFVVAFELGLVFNATAGRKGVATLAR